MIVMSEKAAKKLRTLSTIVFVAQAIIFVICAFYFLQSSVVLSLVFSALALVSVFLILLFYKLAGDLIRDDKKKAPQNPADIYAPNCVHTMTHEYKTHECDALVRASAAKKEADASAKSEKKTTGGAKSGYVSPLPDRGFKREKERLNAMLKRGIGASISAGALHTVAVVADGSVRAAGYNAYDQCETDDWQNVIAVAAGSYHTVVLFGDGTCDAKGADRFGQCDVGS